MNNCYRVEHHLCYVKKHLSLRNMETLVFFVVIETTSICVMYVTDSPFCLFVPLEKHPFVSCNKYPFPLYYGNTFLFGLQKHLFNLCYGNTFFSFFVLLEKQPCVLCTKYPFVVCKLQKHLFTLCYGNTFCVVLGKCVWSDLRFSPPSVHWCMRPSGRERMNVFRWARSRTSQTSLSG